MEDKEAVRELNHWEPLDEYECVDFVAWRGVALGGDGGGGGGGEGAAGGAHDSRLTNLARLFRLSRHLLHAHSPKTRAKARRRASQKQQRASGRNRSRKKSTIGRRKKT